jgi:nitrile hydratase alpha subunit
MPHDHHDHDHDHDHEHDDHAPIEDGHHGEDELLEIAIRELLIEKGVLSAEQIARQIDAIESRTPALGAKVVARAWVDGEFRARLLAEPREAVEAAFGLDLSGPAELRVLANEPGVHNVVVCTLCSCYPRMLLGPPPAWYKATAYRARVVRDPRGVLAEFGLSLPEAMEVRVSDSTADLRYLVLPERPAGTDGLDEDALAGLVTRDCMIGTALPRPA